MGEKGSDMTQLIPVSLALKLSGSVRWKCCIQLGKNYEVTEVFILYRLDLRWSKNRKDILWVILKIPKRGDHRVIMWNMKMWMKWRASGSSVRPILAWRVLRDCFGKCDSVKWCRVLTRYWTLTSHHVILSRGECQSKKRSKDMTYVLFQRTMILDLKILVLFSSPFKNGNTKIWRLAPDWGEGR